MKSLTPTHLAFLSQFGFDPDLLEHWRQGLRDGWLSEDSNQIREQLLAPARDQIRDMPKQGTEARKELEAIGAESIRNGELGIVVLNGGMATRFGGVVKGTVEVFGGRSFLALKIADAMAQAKICEGRIPILLMNSFATQAATAEHCETHANFGAPADSLRHFTQFVSVRLAPDGAIFETTDKDISPYGPGHGDFSFALRASGELQRFLDGGGKHLLLSNVDNLGGRVSPAILGHHIKNKAQVTVENAPKWPGDVGGSPYVVDGKLQLVEQIRYPEGFDPEVVDVFNTNNFHFDAAALDRDFDLGWYFVEKTVGDKKAVQIERLVGELTKFLKSNFLRVKRTGENTRFLPIKTPDDLESSRDEITELYLECSPVDYLGWLLVASASIALVERIRPARPRQPVVRRQLVNDLFYLLFNGHGWALLTGSLIGWIATSTRGGLDSIGALPDAALLAGTPFWLQFTAYFLISDFLQWSVHRLLHAAPWLWQFHKVHHSVREMDWAANFRFHWMELVVYRSLLYLPLLLLGGDGEPLFAVAVFATFWGHFNHANIGIDIGPLGYLMNSPRMHMWHHDASDEGGVAKNFGIVLSCWDWLFGTAFWPRDRAPERIGYPGDRGDAG